MSVVESVRRKLLGGDDGVSIEWGTVGPIPLTQREIHDLLSSDRRRLMLAALVLDYNGRATMSQLSNHVSRVENGLEPEDDLTERQRKRTYVSLYQTHRPKLEDHGVIEWNGEQKTISAKDVALDLVKLDRGVSRASAGVPR